MRKLILPLVFALLAGSLGLKASADSPSFPTQENSYYVHTSKGRARATYKFASPIRKITFNQTNLSTYLGNSFKNIFWIANSYGGGPAGRYDISSPWSPKGPDVIGIASGGSAFAQGTQPAEHKGPFNSGAWPHPPSLRYGGGVLGDNRSGDGRFAFSSGEEAAHKNNAQPRPVTPVVSISPGEGGVSLGQLIDGSWQHVLYSGAYDIDATSAGRFFLLTGGGKKGSGRNETPETLQIFNLTGLSGAVGPSDATLRPVASQAWQNITDLEVVEVPEIPNHFVIARTSGASVTERPRLYIGEINMNTGNIVRSNSVTLDITGVAYTAPWSPAAVVYPGSNLQFANVGSGTYVFMNERFTRFGPSAHQPGTLKVAAYKFNPQDLSLSRIGDLSFENFPNFGYADSEDAWKIIRSDANTAYPIISVLETSKNDTSTNSNGERITQPVLFDLHMFSLKSFLEAQVPQSLVMKDPDIVLKGSMIKKPISMGQVITVGPEQSILGRSTYDGFIKTESGRNNLYLYRRALLWDGRGGDTSMAYAESNDANGNFGQGTFNRLGANFRGVATIRIDKLDVTAFTGTTSVLPPPPSDDGCAPGNTYNTITGTLCRVISSYYSYLTNVKRSPPPVIGAIEGSTRLSSNEQGIWKVSATDPDKDDLSWSVDWGSGRSHETCKISPPAGTSQNWTYSFSHSWTNPGTYTVKVYANDCKGGMSQKSFNVTVQ